MFRSIARRFVVPDLAGLESRFLPSTAAIAPTAWVAPRSRAPRSANTFADLTYTRRAGLTRQLDLAVPTGVAPVGGWPVIVAFPGAGWRTVDRRLLAPQLAGFVRQGYAVAVVDVAYAPERGGPGVWPLNLENARDAVRWVRGNAGRFGVDPNRIVALGESSGANLALLLGSFPDGPALRDQPTASNSSTTNPVSARVQAVVDFYGPTDLLAQFRQPKARDKILTFLGGPPTRWPGRYAAASPLTYISPRTPPTLMIQGTADTTVPPDQTTRLAAALDAAGVANQTILLRGMGHGFQPERGGLDLIPATVAFLDAVLAGRPAP